MFEKQIGELLRYSASLYLLPNLDFFQCIILSSCFGLHGEPGVKGLYLLRSLRQRVERLVTTGLGPRPFLKKADLHLLKRLRNGGGLGIELRPKDIESHTKITRKIL